MGPARMPPDVVSRIYADVLKILARPEIRANLANAGVDPYDGDAAALAKLIRADQIHYQHVARSANIKAE